MAAAPPPPRRSAFGPDRPADARSPRAIVRIDGLGVRDAETVGGDGSIDLLALGPGYWLAVSERGPDEVSAAVAAAAGGSAACTDLTHARVVLRVAGPGAGARLARGCPMDLARVAPGGAAATMLGPFEVVIRRLGAPAPAPDPSGEAFDVFVSRSVTRSARAWLYALDPSV